MASRLFTASPQGTTFEDLEQALRAMAEGINEKRREDKTERFAKVYVTDVMCNPRDSSLWVMVQFSDKDSATAQAVEEILRSLGEAGLQRLQRATLAGQNWFGTRDPYLA